MTFAQAPSPVQNAVRRIAYRVGVVIGPQGTVAGPFDELLGQLVDILTAALMSLMQNCPMMAREMKAAASTRVAFLENYYRLRLNRVATDAVEAKVGRRWKGNKDEFDALVKQTVDLLWDAGQVEPLEEIEAVKRAVAGA